MSWINKKMDEYKRKRAYDKSAMEIIKKKEQAEYYRAKEKEAMKYAHEKATYERKERVKSLKTGGRMGSVMKGLNALASSGGGHGRRSSSPRKSSGGFGSTGTLNGGMDFFGNITGSKPKGRVRKNKRKKKGKTITINLG